MEISPYFQDIEALIKEKVAGAKSEIIIAVAWFTNHDIFSSLLSKVKEVEIHLIVINDRINNRPSGLDFQKFVDSGGHFYFGSFESPMHNKFCIIDNSTLITGSYNYTYLAETINTENILLIHGTSDIISAYRDNFFDNIINGKRPIQNIEEYHLINPFKSDYFSYHTYGIRDVYQYADRLREKGLDEKAEKIIIDIETEENINLNEFVIENIIYEQWKQDYYADKIEVINDLIIVHFRTMVDSGGCWVYGPNTVHCWELRNSDNPHLSVKTHKITNIRINELIEIDSSTKEEIYYFSSKDEAVVSSDSGYRINKDNMPTKEDGSLVPVTHIKTKSRFMLSCEIHFHALELVNETVDLLEGAKAERNDNHWHCLKMNLKLNRLKMQKSGL